MDDFSAKLQAHWQQVQIPSLPPMPPEQIIAEAEKLRRESFKFQRSTLLILSSSFLMMCYFLLIYFRFKEPLSHLGVGLMLGFFFLRIVLETYSLQQGRQKNTAASATETLAKEKKYLRLRLRIHGFYTYLTLSAYTVGFLLLLPEFARHLSAFWMGLFVSAYFIPGIFLTLLIRKNVQKELRELRVVVALQERLLA